MVHFRSGVLTLIITSHLSEQRRARHYEWSRTRYDLAGRTSASPIEERRIMHTHRLQHALGAHTNHLIGPLGLPKPMATYYHCTRGSGLRANIGWPLSSEVSHVNTTHAPHIRG